MRTMKDSGLSWVGEIPSDWVAHPVYYYFGERKNKNIFGQEDNLLSLSYGRVIRKDINTNGGLLPESFNTYNIVEAGDIIIRPTDLQNDKKSLRTGLCLERGIITSAYIALRPIRRLNSGFFRYLLHAYDISKVFYNMGNGVRQGLNFSEFSRLTVFEPPIEIQDKVTQYLDTATAEVDKIISDIQTQIDTLEQYKRSVITETVTKGLNPDAEMKDSGIQWIGDMPAHWGVIRGKYILRYMQKPVRENDGVITCFRDGEVTLRSNRREDGFTMSERKSDIKASMLTTWLFTVWTALLVLSASLIHAVRLLRCSMCWIPTNASGTSCIIFAVWLTAMCSLLWRPAFVCAPVTFGGTSWQSFPIRYRRWMSRMPS